AVEHDVEGRRVEPLLDADVREARDPPQVLEHAISHLAIAGDVRAFDLDVDRGRQAEVEDLRHDVGGQEVEGQRGELDRQPLPQDPDVVGGGPMVRLQGDLDVRVGGADDPGRAVHPVDAAV